MIDGYYIRNEITGALVCGKNLSPLYFSRMDLAVEYIKDHSLNTNIYKVVFSKWLYHDQYRLFRVVS